MLGRNFVVKVMHIFSILLISTLLFISIGIAPVSAATFELSKNLKYGNQVQIHAWGLVYAYEVRESKLVTSRSVNTSLQSEEYDWLTLVTCEFHNLFSGEYLFRRVVKAVLVSIK